MRSNILGFLLCVAAIHLAFAQPISKIAPEVRSRANSGAPVSVLIVLREQPQAEVVQRIEGAARPRLQVAEEDYRRTAALPGTAEADLNVLQSRLDRVVVDTRREIVRELDARVRPAQEGLISRLAQRGAFGMQRFLLINMVAAEATTETLDVLESDPEVAVVLPNEVHQAQLNYSVPTIGAPSYWNRGFTGGGQSVAVLDSGMNLSHPAFTGEDVQSQVFGKSANQGFCFSDDVNSPSDMQGHGTHVAGIVASRGTADYPFNLGVAKKLGTVYNLKVGFVQKLILGLCKGGASASTGDVVAAIEWAYGNTPVKIFNYSYGGAVQSDDDSSARLIDVLADSFDLTIVIAAGNSGENGPYTVESPGIAYNSITVANADDRRTLDRSDDVIAPSSSRGPTLGNRYKPDITAPGTLIGSAAYDSTGFVYKTGTSMAAPHVAGAAALLRQSGITKSQAIKAVLINTADGDGWRSDWGWGYINLAQTIGHANYFLDTIAAASSIFYRGRSGAPLLKATLVWNRHVVVSGNSLASAFNNMDLMLYDRFNNTLLTSFSSLIQNVEQVRSSTNSDVVLKVRAVPQSFDGGISSELFALAISESGFVKAAPPSLKLTCVAPSQVAPSATFSVTCEVANTGDIEAFGGTGTVTAPAPFTAVANISFGTVPAGGRVSRSWVLTAPSAGGTYEFSASVASHSYGDLFFGSAQWSVMVRTGIDSLVVPAAPLSFSYRVGDAAPAAKSLLVSSSSGSLKFSASSSASWLVVAPSAGSTPINISASINTSGLAAGTYNGNISIASQGAANSPIIVPVTLVVDGSVQVSISNRLMTKSLPSGPGCQVPTAATTFLATDSQSFVWFLIAGASAGDRATIDWRAPDGTVYQSGAWSPVASKGNWCFSSGLDIAGKPPASRPGSWSARISWNGATLFTQNFTILQPVTVRTQLLTKSLPDGNGCPSPTAATQFLTTDPSSILWFLVDGAATGAQATAEWRAPDHSLQKKSTWTPLSSSGSWCFNDALSLAGTPAAALTGTWEVRVFWNGLLIFTLNFTLSPPVVVETTLMTKAAPDGLSCAQPERTTSFLRTDSQATIWFSVSGAHAGDQPSSDWYSPSGNYYTTISWDPLPSDGNWCLWAWIDVTNNPPEGMFGEWKTSVSWNGAPLFDVPFIIAPVKVVAQMTTKTIPNGSGCPVPTPASTFLPSDSRTYVWFNVSDANAGDQARVEWRAPDGSLYLSLSWDPLISPGNWCLWGWMAVNGFPPAMTLGNWNARLYWNDTTLSKIPFTINATSGGQEVTASMASAQTSETTGGIGNGEALGFPALGSGSPLRIGREGQPRTGGRGAMHGSSDSAVELVNRKGGK